MACRRGGRPRSQPAGKRDLSPSNGRHGILPNTRQTAGSRASPEEGRPDSNSRTQGPAEPPRAGPSPCALTEAALSPRARGRLVGQSVGQGPTDLGGEGGELADGLTLATLYSERSSVWEKNLRTIRDKPPENKENSEVVTDSRRTQTR